MITINGDAIQTIDILIFMTIVMLLPSILIAMTSFTRVIVVVSFLKNGMGLQQTPPSQVLIGIALFLTLFIMHPVLSEINTQAYQPYANEEITLQEAASRAEVPIKNFMLQNTENKSLNMFLNFAKMERPADTTELPLTVVIPAFMTSELKRAFTMGFLLLLPFLVIDMIVASILMSMGMMMLPPTMISLPFKVLIFILVDGWQLLMSTLVQSFH